MLGQVYRQYLKFLERLGRLTRSSKPEDEAHSISDDATKENISLENLDSLATSIGNSYRGMGVLVGILGMTILFCALAPIGFDLQESERHWLNWIEISLMALSIGIFIYGKRSNIHNRWLNARRQAEIKRYEKLNHLIVSVADSQIICDELFTILDGTNGQIAYNRSKQNQYENIENATSILTWSAFAVAFSAALAHLFVDVRWFIFLTAYFPAIGGAIHGINGFLEIGELESSHHEMWQLLTQYRALLNDLDFRVNHSSAETHDKLVSIASEIYNALTKNDIKWAETAIKQTLKPV